MPNNIKALIHKCQNFALDIFAPRKCAGCRKNNEDLCPNCLSASFRFGASCVFCNFRNNTGRVCHGCRKNYEPKFEKAFWAGEYANALKNAVKELKYARRKELAEPLAKLMHKKFVEFHPNLKPEKFLIIPIPMHPKKEYARGFNQAEILAQEFSKISNIPIVVNLLYKSADTKTQVETKKKDERIKNLENAFGVELPPLPPPYKGGDKTIILIDDVATTGATFMHASLALSKIEGRAPKIICLAIAHGYG